MEANESWWGGAPKVKTLVFRPIPEHTTRVAALQAGEVDIVTNVPPHLVKQVESDAKLYISKAPSVRVIYIWIYTHKYDKDHKVVGPVDWPTKDKRVRQAINYAVNVDEIIKNVLEGNGIRTATVLTDKHFGFDPKLQPFKQDVAKAKQLLTEAGYPNGIDIVLNSPDGRYLKDKEVAEALGGQLTKAGIRTTVKTSRVGHVPEPDAVRPQRRADVLDRLGQHDVGRRRNPRADLPLRQDASRTTHNEQYDSLLDEAATTVDPKARQALYSKALQIFMDDAPAIPLYQQMDIYGVGQAGEVPGPVVRAARGRLDLPGRSEVLGGTPR